jgi:putative DNA primase/helicase
MTGTVRDQPSPTGNGAERVTPSLTAASQIVPRAVSWLWRGYLAIGKVSVLDGRPGLFKSGMSLDIAGRVTTGSRMPDGFDPVLGPRNVLIVTAEDDWEDTVVPRLMAAGADLQRVYRLDDLVLPDGCEQLEAHIREIAAAFVVIDPLVAFVPSRYNLYRDQDSRGVLKPLAAVMQRTACAALGLRHVSKMSGIPAQDRGTGSVAIGGAARSNLIAGKDPDEEGRYVLASIKNNLGPEPPSLGYRLVEARQEIGAFYVGVPIIEWIGAVDIEADDLVGTEKQGEAAEFLLLTLRNGPVAAKHLEAEARARGLSWTGAVRRASERMGILKRPTAVGVENAAWMWSLPEVAVSPNPAQDAQHAQDGSWS